jgi:hypothetical protein
MKTFTDQKTKKQLVAHGDYSCSANCRTKISAIFRGIFGIFRAISKFLCVYSTISRGTPNDYLRNTTWETLGYTD